MIHYLNCLLFGMPGPMELIVILLIVLLVVGPKRLPELMKALGKSIQSFKKGMKEADFDDNRDTTDSDKKDKQEYKG